MSRYRRLGLYPPHILASGVTRMELFEHAGFGIFDLAFDIAGVAPTFSRPLVAPGDTYEELLVNWLEELLRLSETEGLVWSWFTVDRLEEGGVQGSAAGQSASAVVARGPRIAGVAGLPRGIVTVPEGYWAEVVFAAGPRLSPV